MICIFLYTSVKLCYETQRMYDYYGFVLRVNRHEIYSGGMCSYVERVWYKSARSSAYTLLLKQARNVSVTNYILHSDPGI